MKITTEQLPNCIIALTVEPEPERVDEALKRAARKVAQKYTVPGYRKGKAPYAAVVRAYGKEALYEQVVEDMGDEVYREALVESGLEPIAPGELQDVSFDPLVFHLLLPMAPEVDLGDYRSVRVERTEVVVDEADVDKEIARLQESHADWVPVEEDGAQYGDLLTMQLVGTVDDAQFIEDEAFEIELQEENDVFPPGFDANFLGAKADDSLSFDIEYPEDWHTARTGSIAHFDTTVLSVTRRELPQLDDDFASLVGDFNTLDDLKASIRSGMLEEAKTEADNEYANTVLGQIIEVATIEYPDVLLEDYTERAVREQTAMISRLGIPFAEYLRLVGQTEAQFRAQVKEGSRTQLLGDLVMQELIDVEFLEPTDEEIDARIQELLDRERDDIDEMREMLESEGGRHAVMHDVERRNAIQRMIAIAEGTAPSLEEVEAQAAERAAREAAAEALDAETDDSEDATPEAVAELVEEPVATVAAES